MIAPGRTTVGRLRLADSDAAPARLRAGAVLGASDLRPRGLSPAAVLCVRSLRDPRPRVLRLRHDAVRAPPEWEVAVREALEQAVRRAARPALGAVPAAADAVLFADRAELLAALARDAAAGLVAAHWWWRELFAHARVTGAEAVAEAWAAAPEYVPAALERLAERGEAPAAVRAIAPPAARRIADRVAEAFALPALRRVLAGDEPAAARPRAREREPWSSPDVEPPWRKIVPETAAAELAPEQEELLGVALVVRRSPAVARSRAFAEAVARSRRARSAAGPPQNPSTSAPPVATGAPPHFAAAAADRPAPPATEVEDATPARVFRAPRRAGSRRREQPVARPRPGQAPRPRGKPTSPTAAAPPAPPLAEPAPEAPDLPEPAERSLPEAVETELGGLFHLVTLAIALGLYGDFMNPRRPGIDLDPWDFVTLLGRELLDDVDDSDPVWALLGELAGPRVFRPPRHWRVPPAWVKPFGAGGLWRWSGSGGRLRVEHPVGFLVLDIPSRPIESALRRYARSPVTRRVALPREPRRPLERWVSRLARYLDARLRLAAVTPDALLRRPARVHVTDSHVDVVSALADLPIEVRIAGLDRDPGFVPAAGRYLAFHFE